jgi:hypothetical protein
MTKVFRVRCYQVMDQIAHYSSYLFRYDMNSVHKVDPNEVRKTHSIMHRVQNYKNFTEI